MSGSERVESLAADVRDAVLGSSRFRAAAGRSKPALSSPATFDAAHFVGVLEYDPQEFTFTALAGTPVRDIDDLLARNGQYLPFDPPFAQAGATLGGTVAAGLSGPGRFRSGGVRDFLIGTRFVSGDGTLVTGGGKVVKNAAGFDFPKLMVGSLGRFGVMIELTFKVFPRPEAFASLIVPVPDTAAGVAAMHRLASSAHELTCLDLVPPSRLLLRIGGLASALEARVDRLRAFCGGEGEVLLGEADEALWQREREFTWLPAGHALVKIALSPTSVPALEEALAGLGPLAPRRYGVGGNVAYVAWPDDRDRDRLDASLRRLAVGAVALTGVWRTPLLGAQPGLAFAERIARVLDPSGTLAAHAEGVTDAA